MTACGLLPLPSNQSEEDLSSGGREISKTHKAFLALHFFCLADKSYTNTFFHLSIILPFFNTIHPSSTVHHLLPIHHASSSFIDPSSSIHLPSVLTHSSSIIIQHNPSIIIYSFFTHLYSRSSLSYHPSIINHHQHHQSSIYSSSITNLSTYYYAVIIYPRSSISINPHISVIMHLFIHHPSIFLHHPSNHQPFINYRQTIIHHDL